jgi:hypothetical protein
MKLCVNGLTLAELTAGLRALPGMARHRWAMCLMQNLIEHASHRTDYPIYMRLMGQKWLERRMDIAYIVFAINLTA